MRVCAEQHAGSRLSVSRAVNRAGLAACLLVLQYDVHPFVGLSFGPITFLICVLGGLGNFVGGFIAAFVFAEIISLGGLFRTSYEGKTLREHYGLDWPASAFKQAALQHA